MNPLDDAGWRMGESVFHALGREIYFCYDATLGDDVFFRALVEARREKRACPQVESERHIAIVKPLIAANPHRSGYPHLDTA